jgi:acyl carrier protein
MYKAAIEERVRHVIAHHLRLSKKDKGIEKSLDLHDDIIKMYNLDSLDGVAISMGLELYFPIKIDDSIFHRMRTVDEIVDYINGELNLI